MKRIKKLKCFRAVVNALRNKVIYGRKEEIDGEKVADDFDEEHSLRISHQLRVGFS